MTSEFPLGTVTFLFTDLEGSTRLWEEQPTAMRTALAQHDLLLRSIVESQGGRIIKTTGDGLHAVFARASEGVAASLACQQALASETWTGLANPLRVRMGVHTGEAELRDGDYYGSTTNRAARLMSIAAGGQILLSAATSELVNDSLPGGVSLVDLGEHRLKDLTRPEHVFQLSGTGLPADFPPLRSLNTLPNNLPLQLTSFVGREHEMAETRSLLASTRLLTMTGPGGTGKTRLALQAAAEIVEAFSAGVWLVELAPLSDPGLIASTVSSALGVRESPGRPLMDALIDYLRLKSLLLILDNCEHLIDACAGLVTTLLGDCPKVKILSTCREPLGVAGEVIYRVPSLSLPEAHAATIEAMLQSEAVQLFLERARAVQPHFALTERNLHAAAQICQRLDGIPLALELAVARLRLFTVEQIAARLDDRFRLLTGGSRSALPRQQTLRALIDWSYDLLPPAEQQALNRLSVFAGGWTYEAAEALLGPDALDLLSRLVDKSMVVVDDLEQIGETRFHLLETIRQYARDRLLESGEAPEVRDLHLAIFLALGLEAAPKLETHEMIHWLDRLDAEQDNLRAALEWALESDSEAALKLAVSIFLFWRNRGHHPEGLRWLSECLRRCDALPPVEGEADRQRRALRARALCASGMMEFGLGELPAARVVLEECVALAREIGELHTLCEALGMLGFVVIWLGDAAAVDPIIQEGLQLCQITHDKRDIAVIKSIQANQAAQFHGDLITARAYSQEALRLYRDDLGNPWMAAIALMGFGYIAAFQGNFAEASTQFQQNEMIFRQLGNQHMVIAMQSEQAHLERQQGHLPQALSLYRQTLTAWQQNGHRASLAHELECFAFIAVAQGQGDRAARLLGAAEALRESIDSPMRATERGDYDQNVSDLRAQMDPDGFAEAWSLGRGMTIEQAVEFALAEG